MAQEKSPQGSLAGGDIVVYEPYGAGRVITIEDSPRPTIVLEFPQYGTLRLDADVASRALTRLPADGLEAMLLNEPEQVAEWPQTAPLKLIGAALADFGKPAKPADLERKLQRLLPSRWDSWWKRVQPSVLASPCFRRRTDGQYELRVPPTDIPKGSLPTAPRRVPPPRPQATEVGTIVARLEANEVGLETVPGADTQRLIARELIHRAGTSERALRVVTRTLEGPVIAARIITGELLKAGPCSYLSESLVFLADHIRTLATAPLDEPVQPGEETTKPTGEHIAAKTRILADLASGLARDETSITSSELQVAVEKLLSVALSLWHPGHAEWRKGALDSIADGLAAISAPHPAACMMGGTYLATAGADVSARLTVLERWVARISEERRRQAIDCLLSAALGGSVDYTRACLNQLLGRDEQLSWLAAAARRLVYPRNGEQAERIALLMRDSSYRGEHDYVRARLSTTLLLALASSDVGHILTPSIRDDLAKLAASEGGSSDSGHTNPVIEAFMAVYSARAETAHAEAARVRDELETQVLNLHDTIDALREERTGQQNLIEQLQTGYRAPERWAAFQGRREVILELVSLHQELALSQLNSASAAQRDHWLVARVEGLLQRFGVRRFGTTGDIVGYDPALHEYLADADRVSTSVLIQCNGFEWDDPAGKRVILARARVVPH
jgi:hypothetical protein